MTQSIPRARLSMRDVLRGASTGAFATLGLFLLCWVTVPLGMPLSSTHSFVALFTMQPVGSMSALWMGGLWAFFAGGVAGAMISHCYNLAGRMFGP